MNKEKAIKILQDCIDYINSCNDSEYDDYNQEVARINIDQLDFAHKVYLVTKDNLC